MPARTYHILEIDPSGDGTLVWQARWDGGETISIYRGTISDEEIVVSRLQSIVATSTKGKIKHEQFVAMATEFITEMIKNKITY
jgi:hypothetical protein